MTSSYDIIVKPIITEGSMDQVADKKYTFQVKIDANKVQIKKAIEEIFGVEVEYVHTMRFLGKMKRMGKYEGKRPDWKKAVVKLTESSKTIDIFEG